MRESFDLDAGTQRLRVHHWGVRGAPVVVLVHGYPDTHAVWQKIAEDLAREYHVVAFDVRGAGESSVPTRLRDYRLHTFVGDLKAVIDHVSPVQPVHLVGHDWGSIHSWESVTGEELKGRIASFTSISGPSLDHAAHWIRHCIMHPTPSNLRKLALQLSRSWYVMMFHLPFVGRVWRMGLGRMWPRILEATEGAIAEASPTQSEDGYRGVAMYRANFVFALLSPRKRVAHVPVQVVAPLNDRYVSPALSERLSDWVPQLWRREIQAGHWVLLTHPELIASYVRDFVSSVESGTESSELRRTRVHGELKRSLSRAA